MRVRFLPFLCLTLVCCAHQNGCGEDIYAESGGTEASRPPPPPPATYNGASSCAYAGGSCTYDCNDGYLQYGTECDYGRNSACCIPNVPTFTPPPPSPSDGTCNGVACGPGCRCRPTGLAG